MTTSARQTTREVSLISSPLEPPNPLPSQRSKLSLRLLRTGSPRPRRPASSSAASQWLRRSTIAFRRTASGSSSQVLSLSSGGRPRPTAVPREVEQIDGSSHVVVVAVPLQRDVISEPLCLLICIRVAAHPRQQPREVGDFALSLIEGEELGHPQRDESLPQDVLHRLPKPKVSAERDRGNQFGEADSRGSGSAHGTSLDNRSGELPNARLYGPRRASPVLSAGRAPERQSSPLGVSSSLERGQPITHLKPRSSPGTPAAVGRMRGPLARRPASDLG